MQMLAQNIFLPPQPGTVNLALSTSSVEIQLELRGDSRYFWLSAAKSGDGAASKANLR
jgi:hypothetical protein